MFMRLHAAMICVACGAKMEAGPRVVTKFDGQGCVQTSTADTWTISSPGPNDLEQCTYAVHTTRVSQSGGSHLIEDLSLAKLQRGMQALHLTCSSDASSSLGSYYTSGHETTPSCSSAILVGTFQEAEHTELIAGRCATSVQGSSYRVDVSGLNLPTCTPGVTGDPHLTNLRGQKFDIHDGLHRLVHYPRGAPEDEALLMVDAKAVDMGADANCYAIFLESVRMSGRWLGDDINISANIPVASSSTSDLGSALVPQQMDWLEFLKQRIARRLMFKGSMPPVTVTTSIRNASTDTMGGEQMSFNIGEHPVVVQIWASQGHNILTHGKGVRYLNVQVKNLPQDAGGIIGLDGYTKPTTSRCHFPEQVNDASYRGVSLLGSTRRMTFHWTAFATVQSDE